MKTNNTTTIEKPEDQNQAPETIEQLYDRIAKLQKKNTLLRAENKNYKHDFEKRNGKEQMLLYLMTLPKGEEKMIDICADRIAEAIALSLEKADQEEILKVLQKDLP